VSAHPEIDPPAVARWELPQYYRRLKAAVLAFEGAWEEWRLEAALTDPDLAGVVGGRVLGSYARLLQVDAGAPSPFRRNSIHALFEPLKELLEEPHRVFSARGVAVEPSPQDSRALRPGGSVRLRAVELDFPEGPVVLRLHQVVSTRFWNIGIELEDPEDDAWLTATLVRLALRRLAADLNGLRVIEAWLARRRLHTEPRIVPDPRGRRFEQLMIDILNEERYSARRASLVEDFLEKTDLRVHVDGLDRRKGARVQVTQTTHPGQLEKKLSRIRRVREFVILTPRTLAEALTGGEGEELLNRGELKDLWGCLEYTPATVDDLSRLIKERFLASYRTDGHDPRGPAASVPEPLRLLVRRFVRRDALRSTRRLRRRESGRL